jgi:alpha-ketoglutarate-dependent 2,4-dichlorophenoxyacetate dioxygenase
MPLEIKPFNPKLPDFVAKVEGFSLGEPLAEEKVEGLLKALDHFAVLVFPNQVLSDEQQSRFSCYFGNLEMATGDYMKPEDRRLKMEINDISNLNRSGKKLDASDPKRLFSLGNMLWHSDSSFKAIPAQYSILSAKIIPSTEGDTEFADMRAAWRAMDPKTQQQCLGLVTRHSQLYSRGELGFTEFREDQQDAMTPVRQALVRRHPRTKNVSLYLSAHAGVIEGWTIPEARIFLKRLVEHATQREFVYRHRWQVNDLVIWDNQVTMHRAIGYDNKEVRDMRRTTIAGVHSSLVDMPT